MPAQQAQWIGTAYLETGTIARGQVACLNEAGTKYIIASAANRSSAGHRSACIALSNGDADNPAGSDFEAQYVGAVPPSITGLGAGTESLIRVSSAGVLERVASYSTSDDVCGHCDEDGTAYVCFPLVGLGAALGASSAPGLPARSIQYYLDANTLGGAAHAGISTDGYIESGTAPFPTTGTHRFSANSSVVALSTDGATEVPVWGTAHFNATADRAANDVVYFGWNGNSTIAAGRVFGFAKLLFNITANTGSSIVGFRGVSPGFFTGAPTARFLHAHPNIVLAPDTLTNSAMSADPLNGGLGYLFIEDVAAIRGGAIRTSGFGLWSRAADHHPMATIGSTDYDLLSEGIFALITSTGTIADVDVTGVRTVKVASNGNVTIPGLIAPTAGQSQHVTLILEPPADTTYTLSNNNGDDLANGFDFGGSDLTVANPAKKVFAVVYDHDAELWKPVGVSA